ncbi:MAG: pilus assembly protein PilM [Sandaracinaceae bacterium]|nr:pilus assembly protein PilM [Sandaracinaceae bacterium]
MARILGLDIGTTMVRGAILRTALRKADVEQYLEVPVNGDVKAAIRELISAQGGRMPDSVIVGLRGEDASLRTIEVPEAAAKRIDEVLPFELEAVLPFSPDEAIIDSQPISRADGRLHVLAAAMPRERVRRLLEELLESNISPQEIAVGAAALDGLVALVPDLQTPGPFLILDIGEKHTDLCILHKGRTELARTITRGPAAADAQNVELGRAIQQTVAMYRASGGPEITRVLLAGGGGISPGMAEFLAGQLNQSVEFLSLPNPTNIDPSILPVFARAAALAGRVLGRGKRIDARRGDFAHKRAMGALRQQTGLLAACAGVVLCGFIFSTWADYRVQKTRHAVLVAELERVTERVLGEKTNDSDAARRLLEGRTGANDPLPHFDAFDALSVISDAIPSDIHHDTTRLIVELASGTRDGRFELKGTVSDIAERDRISEALSAHRCIHDMNNGRTSGQERINYQITGVLRCGERAAPSKNRNSTTGGSP